MARPARPGPDLLYNASGDPRAMSLARDITTVGGGTLLSRLLAYFRDAGIAALLLSLTHI